MKRDATSIDDIALWGNLIDAFQKAARGKSTRKDVQAFRADLSARLEALQTALLLRRVKPELLRAFRIRDPKPRLIHAPSFRDRVLHSQRHEPCRTGPRERAH